MESETPTLYDALDQLLLAVEHTTALVNRDIQESIRHNPERPEKPRREDLANAVTKMVQLRAIHMFCKELNDFEQHLHGFIQTTRL